MQHVLRDRNCNILTVLCPPKSSSASISCSPPSAHFIDPKRGSVQPFSQSIYHLALINAMSGRCVELAVVVIVDIIVLLQNWTHQRQVSIRSKNLAEVCVIPSWEGSLLSDCHNSCGGSGSRRPHHPSCFVKAPHSRAFRHNMPLHQVVGALNVGPGWSYGLEISKLLSHVHNLTLQAQDHWILQTRASPVFVGISYHCFYSRCFL